MKPEKMNLSKFDQFEQFQIKIDLSDQILGAAYYISNETQPRNGGCDTADWTFPGERGDAQTDHRLDRITANYSVTNNFNPVQGFSTCGATNLQSPISTVDPLTGKTYSINGGVVVIDPIANTQHIYSSELINKTI